MKKDNLNEEKFFALYVLQENPACGKATQSCARGGLDPVFGQRFDGIPNEAVEQDQDRQALIFHLVRQVLNTSKKQEWMEELISRRRKGFYAFQ